MDSWGPYGVLCVLQNPSVMACTAVATSPAKGMPIPLDQRSRETSFDRSRFYVNIQTLQSDRFPQNEKKWSDTQLFARTPEAGTLKFSKFRAPLYWKWNFVELCWCILDELITSTNLWFWCFQARLEASTKDHESKKNNVRPTLKHFGADH